MTITIEISEKTAACLWSDKWKQPDTTVAKLVEEVAEDAADAFHRAFPESVERAVSDFRAWINNSQHLLVTPNR